MATKKKVKKLGMKDIQRTGWEYELTVSLNLDRDTHTAIASKDRTNVFEKLDPFIISEKTGKLIKKWCDTGVEDVSPIDPLAEPLAAVYAAPTREKLKAIWNEHKPLQKDPTFLAAVNQRKAELNPTDQELIDTPKDPLLVK